MKFLRIKKKKRIPEKAISNKKTNYNSLVYLQLGAVIVACIYLSYVIVSIII